MGAGSPPSNTTSKTTAEPPKYLQQYLKNAAQYAQNLYTYQPDVYQGFGANERAGLDQQLAIARQGNPISGGALSNYTDTMNGRYMDPSSNPWLAEVANRAAMEAEGRINSQYAGAGRTRSGAWANALADANTQARADLYGQNYQNERQIQANYAMNAPQLAGLPFLDAERITQVGGLEAANEERIRSAPYERLDRLVGYIYGNPGNQQLSQTSRATASQGRSGYDALQAIGGLLG